MNEDIEAKSGGEEDDGFASAYRAYIDPTVGAADRRDLLDEFIRRPLQAAVDSAKIESVDEPRDDGLVAAEISPLELGRIAFSPGPPLPGASSDFVPRSFDATALAPPSNVELVTSPQPLPPVPPDDLPDGPAPPPVSQEPPPAAYDHLNPGETELLAWAEQRGWDEFALATTASRLLNPVVTNPKQYYFRRTLINATASAAKWRTGDYPSAFDHGVSAVIDGFAADYFDTSVRESELKILKDLVMASAFSELLKVARRIGRLGWRGLLGPSPAGAGPSTTGAEGSRGTASGATAPYEKLPTSELGGVQEPPSAQPSRAVEAPSTAETDSPVRETPPTEPRRPDWKRLTSHEREAAIREELEFRKRIAIERADRIFEPSDAPHPRLESATYGNILDVCFKAEVIEAVGDGYLPPELEVTPSNLNVARRGMVSGVDIVDPVNRTGWELTTDRGWRRHKTYVLSPPQGAGRIRLLRVHYLTHPGLRLRTSPTATGGGSRR